MTLMILPQRPVLAYPQNDSFDGGLNQVAMGVSTSSTSHSSKSSSALYHPDSFYMQNTTTSSSNPNHSNLTRHSAGITPYAYDPAFCHTNKALEGKPAQGMLPCLYTTHAPLYYLYISKLMYNLFYGKFLYHLCIV